MPHAVCVLVRGAKEQQTILIMAREAHTCASAVLLTLSAAALRVGARSAGALDSKACLS